MCCYNRCCVLSLAHVAEDSAWVKEIQRMTEERMGLVRGNLEGWDGARDASNNWGGKDWANTNTSPIQNTAAHLHAGHAYWYLQMLFLCDYLHKCFLQTSTSVFLQDEWHYCWRVLYSTSRTRASYSIDFQTHSWDLCVLFTCDIHINLRRKVHTLITVVESYNTLYICTCLFT